MAAPPRIFICYARSDNASDDPNQRWLDRLLQMLGPLERRGLVKAWSDNDVEPGEDWHHTIQASLDQAVATVLMVSPAFLNSDYINNSELPVLLKNAQQRGVTILPLIVRPSLYDTLTFKYPDPEWGPEEIALATFLAVNPVSKPLTTMTQAEQDATLLTLARRLKDIVESQPAPLPPPPEPEPYQGLSAFTDKTRQFFFGREAEVEELVDRLAGANFVPVIGNSGSGKSSVVRAGLMPWATSQGWQVLGPIKPGIDPMPKLKASFEEVFNNREIRAICEQIDAEGLVGVLSRLPPGQRYLLVVDQFEEVFTVCTNKDHRQRFIAGLTGLGQQGDAPLKVVTTMRSDFVPQWLSSDPLTRVIQRQAVWLGPLLGEPLVQAIVRPAQALGYTLENGLLELILDDVAQEENCLPLLEFALAELWQQRDTRRRVLTVAAYRAMGRLRGALAQRAETIYNHTLRSDLERQWCRHLCLELVRIGPEGTDTRSRQPRASLLGQHRTAKEQEVFDQVLETLVEERLLVADNDTLDLTHEALMAGWPRFATWRDENRDQLRLVQRLKDAHAEWLAKGRSDAYLVQGGLLAELRESWAALKTEATLAAGLTDFFSLSDDHEQQKVAALEKALAEAELRAECSRIANLPSANAVDKTLLTIKVVADSLNALQGEVIAPVQDALHRAFTHPCERLRLEGHSGGVWSVAFSPQGDRIVSGGTDGTLRLWPGGRWPDWLYTCSLRLLRHHRLTQAGAFKENDMDDAIESDLEKHAEVSLERQVCDFCQQRVWPQADLAAFYQAQGIALAYQGDVKAATTALEQAQQLNADLVSKPGAMAKRLAAVTLLNQAQGLAKTGEQPEALAKFAAAQALDPAIALDPQTRYNQLRAIGLITQGQQWATQSHGDLKLTETIAAFAEA